MGQSDTSPNEAIRWFDRNVKYIFLALLAIGAVSLVVIAQGTVHQASVAASRGQLGPIPTFTSTAMPDTRTTAVFLGDSYTAGVGTTSTDKRWTTLVASAEGWDEINDGEGGTGFVATATQEGCGKTFCGGYPTRVAALIKERPDVVVIAGGQNDFPQYAIDPAPVQQAITSVYSTIRKALPDATIVAVGPSKPGPTDAITRAMDTDVQKAARSVNATYVSLISPAVIKASMITEDGGHVDDAGHAAIAARVEASF